MENIVTFTGKIPPNEVAKLYEDADLVLNPTTVDNMPNSVLESLACGVPVVTTNVGGIPYVVKDGQSALFFEPGDAVGMEKQIERLLDDATLYDNLVKNGYAEAQKYLWPSVRVKWLGLYRKMARV